MAQNEMAMAAQRLAQSARALMAVTEHAVKYGVLTLTACSGETNFNGCEQAQALHGWLRTGGYAPVSAIEQMAWWADSYEKLIFSIISGQLTNCDPACMKIIINSGFVAILAERLANAINGAE